MQRKPQCDIMFCEKINSYINGENNQLKSTIQIKVIIGRIMQLSLQEVNLAQSKK